MPEILRLTVDDRVRTLREPGAVLDAATRAVLEAAVGQARAEAYRDGEAAGRASAVDAAEAAADTVRRALSDVLVELRAQVVQATECNLVFATEIATAVLERVPPDDALSVLDRVRRAVDVLDDRPLTVRLHPDDAASLAAADTEGLDLVADPSLRRGDARVVGAHSGAELTRTAMVAAAASVLSEDAV